MATISNDQQPAKLTIPAAYLEDARNAAVREVDSDSGMLRANHAGGSSEDRDSAACILGRDVRLLGELLAATGDIEVTSEQDIHNCPAVDMLEEMVRLLAERLTDAAAYAPIPMGDVLDVAERLRWAAEEAVRIEPGLLILLGSEVA